MERGQQTIGRRQTSRESTFFYPKLESYNIRTWAETRGMRPQMAPLDSRDANFL